MNKRKQIGKKELNKRKKECKKRKILKKHERKKKERHTELHAQTRDLHSFDAFYRFKL